ncbi:putative Eukaryotic translation initiation factor 3 subunit B [Paratrimastix pyriformis]|uniref:Eukaryotic translation initiation factor 3 subunit B n=1 Tax=Paratrimastix pyriformis TaxID=342808 RepID=A0ABQ8UJ95_9EUKA|nr:putative Eukaryotic translation initiation factor 3 subunit B [Paratrimastix pyriformis]
MSAPATAAAAQAAPSPAPEPIIEDLEHDPYLNLENTIIVDNLPNVDREKAEKFRMLLCKIFKNAIPGGIYLYFGENNATKSHAFITFRNPKDASDAVKLGQGYKIDKTHQIILNPFTDFRAYGDVPEVYEAPQQLPYVPKAPLWSHLFDPRGRDQYMIRFNDQFEAQWWDPVQLAQTAVTTKFEGALGGIWSPWGRFYATFHRQGVQLWGGADMGRVSRFLHPMVSMAVFSPCEKYLLTFCEILRDPQSRDKEAVTIITELETGKQLPGEPRPEGPRSNKSAMFLLLGGCAALHKGRPWVALQGSLVTHPGMGWTINMQTTPLRWSHDDKYLARVDSQAQTLHVYDVPAMNERVAKMDNLMEVTWSPSQNLMALWFCRKAEKPAVVKIVDPRDLSVLATKNIFDATKITLYWHEQGDYLCAQCDLQGKKAQAGTSLEIFRMRVRNLPCNSLVLPDRVTSVAWEPRGHHLAVVHGANTVRPDVAIYEVNGDRVLLKDSLLRRQVSCVSWSPMGEFMVLYLKGTGSLEFYSTKEHTVANQTHQFSTEAVWDPSGRFVASSVISTRESLDQGFQIYSYRGDLLHASARPRFALFQWRPRPPCLLSPEQQEAIRAAPHVKKFEEEDAAYRKGMADSKIARRTNMRTSFEAWRQSRAEAVRRLADFLAALPGGAPTGGDCEMEEEEVEELETTETVLGLVNEKGEDEVEAPAPDAEAPAASPSPSPAPEGQAASKAPAKEYTTSFPDDAD